MSILSQRTGLAVASLILSLPAFFAVFAGAFIVYGFAVLGGYNGTGPQAVLQLVSTWKGFMTTMAVLLATLGE